MGAIYGELRVGGHVFPILRCTYGVHQATDGRGRVMERVRFEPVTLLLDVPRGDFLLAWAAAAAKRLPADVVFFDAASGPAVETLSFVTGAYCVNHREDFWAGDAGSGAYLRYLTLSDPDGYRLHAGGPASTAVAPATRDHDTPPVAALLADQKAPASQEAYRKNVADPIRDVLGPGRLSHPTEWRDTLAALQQAGVEIMLTAEERLAYAPGTRPGRPGQVHLHEDASIGALRHEHQHFLDDRAAGYLGTRGLYDLAFRQQTERNAYGLEIAMMEKSGHPKAAAQLRRNLRDELARLERDLSDIELA